MRTWLAGIRRPVVVERVPKYSNETCMCSQSRCRCETWRCEMHYTVYCGGRRPASSSSYPSSRFVHSSFGSPRSPSLPMGRRLKCSRINSRQGNDWRNRTETNAVITEILKKNFPPGFLVSDLKSSLSKEGFRDVPPAPPNCVPQEKEAEVPVRTTYTLCSES
jgi:hypothetical protein